MSALMKLCKCSALRSRQLTKNLDLSARVFSSTTATAPAMQYDKDPAPAFIDAETQRLLKSMTQLHIRKVYRKVTVPDNTPKYKFMTTEELEQEFRQTIERARHRLQMPPVVQVREDVHKIISQDAALQDFSDTKYVITDITFGLRQSERKVVVRQTDGNLEYAPMSICKRMNQLYFPLTGRSMNLPHMFEPEHLKRCLDEHKYEFVLDRLTVQFEPYESQYHSISSEVYMHLNESKQFDLLRSTRHFGPMAFFYAWHRCIDDLLCDMIKRDYLRNGVELIALMYKLNNKQSAAHKQLLQQLDELLVGKEEPAILELRESIRQKSGNATNIEEEIHAAIGKTHEDFKADALCLQFIEEYIKNDALKKVQLELAVGTFKEINLEKQQLLEGLTKAHGLRQSTA